MSIALILISVIFVASNLALVVAVILLTRTRKAISKLKNRKIGVRLLALSACLGYVVCPVALIPVYSNWRPKEYSRRLVDAALLKQIANACLVYASRNAGVLPSDLVQLTQNGQLHPGQLQTVYDPDRENPCDYHYFGNLRIDDPDDWIVGYSNPIFHDGKGTNVFYRDGHVAFVREPEFSQKLSAFQEAFAANRGHAPALIPPR